jgi:hypothetical protein
MVPAVVQPLALRDGNRRRELRPTVADVDSRRAARRVQGIRVLAQWAAKTLKLGRNSSGDLCVADSVGSEREFPPPI